MNELMVKTVNKSLKEYDAIINLIDRSFPENEKYPFWLIRLWGIVPGNDFLVFYDQGIFAGVMLNFCTKDAVFVLYLVVNDQVRSSGYGSGIIQWAKAYYGNRCIILNVEPPNENAENNEQRLRRIRFYEKNGFHKTGYRITEGKDSYLVLSTNEFTPKKFRKAIGRMSFGFYAPKLKKSHC
jgi:ribosomal protein S18 acetylase RimI-like enzyme